MSLSLATIETQLKARGIRSVALTFAAGVNLLPVETVKQQAATFLSAYLNGNYRAVDALGDHQPKSYAT